MRAKLSTVNFGRFFFRIFVSFVILSAFFNVVYFVVREDKNQQWANSLRERENNIYDQKKMFEQQKDMAQSYASIHGSTVLNFLEQQKKLKEDVEAFNLAKSQFESTVAEHEKKEASLKEQFRQLTEDKADIDTTLRLKENKISIYETELKTLSSQLNITINVNNLLKQDLDIKKFQLGKLDEDFDKAIKKLEFLELKNGDLAKSVEELKEDKKSLDNVIEQLRNLGNNYNKPK